MKYYLVCKSFSIFKDLCITIKFLILRIVLPLFLILFWCLKPSTYISKTKENLTMADSIISVHPDKALPLLKNIRKYQLCILFLLKRLFLYRGRKVDFFLYAMISCDILRDSKYINQYIIMLFRYCVMQYNYLSQRVIYSAKSKREYYSSLCFMLICQ